MAKTIRQQLVEAVIAAIKSISVAHGYQTELGTRPVKDWPRRYDAKDLPAVGVHDLTVTSDKENPDSRKQTNDLPIQVRIYTAEATPAATLRQYIGDVIKAVGVDPRWGGLAWDTSPNDDGFIVPDGAFEAAGAAVQFTVHYLSNPFDAYA
jgi:hypothetical protein